MDWQFCWYFANLLSKTINISEECLNDNFYFQS